MKRKPPALHGTISTEEDRIIRERCRPLLEAWGKECWPVMDVNKLVRSIYVLGVMDGMQVEKQKSNPALNADPLNPNRLINQ
jgi:hypothetical protein